MKGYSVYSKIHQLKEHGFRKDTVAKSLGINWRTVDHYWNMSVDEYEANIATVCKGKLLDDYRDTIINWLRDYPTLSAAQVCDWLKEHYDATNILEVFDASYIHDGGQRKNCSTIV